MPAIFSRVNLDCKLDFPLRNGNYSKGNFSEMMEILSWWGGAGNLRELMEKQIRIICVYIIILGMSREGSITALSFVLDGSILCRG